LSTLPVPFAKTAVSVTLEPTLIAEGAAVKLLIVGAATTVSSGRLVEAREQFERRFIEVALARAGGSRAGAARALGVSRQGLTKILARLKPGSSITSESC